MCPDKDKCWRQKVIQLKKLQDTTTNFNKILKNNSKCVFFQADGVCCGNVVVKLSVSSFCTSVRMDMDSDGWRVFFKT